MLRMDVSVHQDKIDKIQLTNRGTDCFVNSVVQLIKNTQYGIFIISQSQSLFGSSNGNEFRISRELAAIYSGRKNSAETLRSLVAQHSGKLELDVNTQQDAEEFFRALEVALSEEWIGTDYFRTVRNCHWGREELGRKFLNNSETGKCFQCGECPPKQDLPFLLLKIKNIPRSTGVSISPLVQQHFSESIETVSMRCSNCCEQQAHQQVPCPQMGICRNRRTVEKCNLTKAPQFLFIQLIRNVGNQPKVNTFIKIESELILPSGQKYELIATLDHIGETPMSGHYITFLKLSTGRWRKFDDDTFVDCSVR